VSIQKKTSTSSTVLKKASVSDVKPATEDKNNNNNNDNNNVKKSSLVGTKPEVVKPLAKKSSVTSATSEDRAKKSSVSSVKGDEDRVKKISSASASDGLRSKKSSVTSVRGEERKKSVTAASRKRSTDVEEKIAVTPDPVDSVPSASHLSDATVDERLEASLDFETLSSRQDQTLASLHAEADESVTLSSYKSLESTESLHYFKEDIASRFSEEPEDAETCDAESVMSDCQPASLSLETVESPATTTVAIHINVNEDPVPLIRVEPQSPPEHPSYVAETRLNVSAVDIEEVGEDESRSSESRRSESRSSEQSLSAASSVEILTARGRSESVSSSSSSVQSVDGYPSMAGFEVPTVTLTAEESSPIVIVESEPDLPSLATESMNRKNLSEGSESLDSNQARSSYWTKQALQNDTAQKINEVIQFHFDFIFIKNAIPIMRNDCVHVRKYASYYVLL
jgi:hypothetical protein